jgi:hypothetical protein
MRAFEVVVIATVFPALAAKLRYRTRGDTASSGRLLRSCEWIQKKGLFAGRQDPFLTRPGDFCLLPCVF